MKGATPAILGAFANVVFGGMVLAAIAWRTPVAVGVHRVPLLQPCLERRAGLDAAPLNGSFAEGFSSVRDDVRNAGVIGRTPVGGKVGLAIRF